MLHVPPPKRKQNPHQDKLECTEELGDLISQVDANMALSVYLRANAAEKVVNSFSQRGEFDKMVAYASKVGYRCDYTVMLQNMVRTNPQGALAFAKKAATTEPPQIDPNTVVETFMASSLVQETTAFLLEALKNNKKDEGYLQTKLLEINLLGGSPQVSFRFFFVCLFVRPRPLERNGWRRWAGGAKEVAWRVRQSEYDSAPKSQGVHVGCPVFHGIGPRVALATWVYITYVAGETRWPMRFVLE